MDCIDRLTSNFLTTFNYVVVTILGLVTFPYHSLRQRRCNWRTLLFKTICCYKRNRRNYVLLRNRRNYVLLKKSRKGKTCYEWLILPFNLKTITRWQLKALLIASLIDSAAATALNLIAERNIYHQGEIAHFRCIGSNSVIWRLNGELLKNLIEAQEDTQNAKWTILTIINISVQWDGARITCEAGGMRSEPITLHITGSGPGTTTAANLSPTPTTRELPRSPAPRVMVTEATTKINKTDSTETGDSVVTRGTSVSGFTPESGTLAVILVSIVITSTIVCPPVECYYKCWKKNKIETNLEQQNFAIYEARTSTRQENGSREKALPVLQTPSGPELNLLIGTNKNCHKCLSNFEGSESLNFTVIRQSEVELSQSLAQEVTGRLREPLSERPQRNTSRKDLITVGGKHEKETFNGDSNHASKSINDEVSTPLPF